MHMAYFFLDIFEQTKEASLCMLLSFNNVIIIIMNAYFPEPPSVLASMFFHFEPDNDFAIRCILASKSLSKMFLKVCNVQAKTEGI
jgi:hypothetical protein